jgi:fumarylacetoacetate (FAA) hydrolase
MKLATLKSTSRDGELVLVDKSLTRAIKVGAIAPHLQYALDNWDDIAPKLTTLYNKLNEGNVENSFSFIPSDCEAPLPRAYQWVDGSAYVNHVELVRKARGAEMPQNFWTDPLMYQGGSDTFLGPNDDVLVTSEDYGIDFESEVVIITDDVPMAITPQEATKHIKLIMLVNDVSLRNLIPAEIGKGFGFLHSKPSSSFTPVAITPDELGAAFKDNKIHLPLVSHLNNELFGQPNAGIDMTFCFGTLIAHAAKTRKLGAGTLIGSGTVSNTDRSSGSSCLAERRMLEIIEHGKPKTSFMHFGDTIRIEMFDEKGASLFGAIDQKIVEA